MTAFTYRDGVLHAEALALPTIAELVGTPCYVYSRHAIERAYAAFAAALFGRAHLLCYAVKANPNIALLSLLARAGAGFDVVSGGELARVLRAGGDAARVVFSGAGKSRDELEMAVAANVGCINVESAGELDVLAEVARDAAQPVRIGVRINPDVDARTHPFIATGLEEHKFGVSMKDAPAVYQRARELPGIEPVAVACHIGSQILDLAPFADAVGALVDFADELVNAGFTIRHVDFGGGLGIGYRGENAPTADAYVRALMRGVGDRPWQIVVAPGRSIVGRAGVLLTRVLYVKQSAKRRFAIVDAGMNDLLRPALYDAWHDVRAVHETGNGGEHVVEIVGPVCESGDFLARERHLSVTRGDLIAVMDAGAYGASMASTYNSRPRCAEVLVVDDQMHVVRERESLAALSAGERIPGYPV